MFESPSGEETSVEEVVEVFLSDRQWHEVAPGTWEPGLYGYGVRFVEPGRGAVDIDAQEVLGTRTQLVAA